MSTPIFNVEVFPDQDEIFSKFPLLKEGFQQSKFYFLKVQTYLLQLKKKNVNCVFTPGPSKVSVASLIVTPTKAVGESHPRLVAEQVTRAQPIHVGDVQRSMPVWLP